MTARLIAIGVLLCAIGAAHAQQGDPKRGEKAFQSCGACHAMDGKSNDVGPALHGVFGRKAAERDDFRYSPALRRSNITWTREAMDAFLADPQRMVPANRMPYAGMPDACERADLIAYMLQVFK